MAILMGVHPGGRGGFAVCGIFWTGRLPGRVIVSRALSGVQAVLNEIIGVAGEWGELDTMAIDAPLSWSPTPTGRRSADDELAKRVPAWAPKSWFRPPNALSGAVAVQGPALTWALAREGKLGTLPMPAIYETHPRCSMARTLRDMRVAILGYYARSLDETQRRAHVASLVRRLIDAGIITLEVEAPATAEELEALVAAITALAITYPATGLVTHEIEGGPIRPVGSRTIAVLDALP